jgi:hypothetical protein
MVSEKTTRIFVYTIQLGYFIRLSPIVWDPKKYGVSLDYGRPLLMVWLSGKIFLVHLLDIIRLYYLSLNLLAITYLFVVLLFLEHTTADACIAFVSLVAVSLGLTAQTIFIFSLGEFSSTINLFYRLDNDLRTFFLAFNT